MPLTDFYKKIVALQEFDIEVEIVDVLKQHSEELAFLLKEQLRIGKDSKGENVTLFGKDYYSDRTVFEKDFHGVGLGKETNFITNYMSGTFYQSIRAKVNSNSFEMVSDIPYFKEILARSGSVIMELSSDHLAQFSQEILIPELQRRFTNKFNGI